MVRKPQGEKEHIILSTFHLHKTPVPSSLSIGSYTIFSFILKFVTSVHLRMFCLKGASSVSP